MVKQIELGIEKLNRGNWLWVNVPYTTTKQMTASLHQKNGATLKVVTLRPGSNLIDIEAITEQSIQVRIDTPFETLLREMEID